MYVAMGCREELLLTTWSAGDGCVLERVCGRISGSFVPLIALRRKREPKFVRWSSIEIE